MPPRPAPHTGSIPPRWAQEVFGTAVAVAVAIGVVAAVAASTRSALLFSDGDSLVTTLVARSIATGQPQDWALSSVLFLPETAMLGMLTLLGLGVNGTLALAGVVNVVALYGALRVAAGAIGRARAPITGALLGLGGFALLAVTETSPDRDALELASLLVTTTYYSATVIGVVLAVGLARRALDVARGAAGVGVSGGSSRGSTASDTAEPATRSTLPVAWGPVALIGAVAAASVLTNPLFAAWASVPLGLVLFATWALTGERVALWVAGALVAGSIVGFVGRMPLDALFGATQLIANSGAGYAVPSHWFASVDYYGALLAERWSAPWGAASVLVLFAVWGWCIAATVVLARRRDAPAAVVAASGWVMPMLVVIGAVALGTNAARYLQPMAFAPMLGLVVLPAMLARRADAGARVGSGFPSRASRAAAAAVAAAVVVAAASLLGIPRIAAAASAPDADLDCVVTWAEQSGRAGAGQFWTVRLPKAHLADPRMLVQVDHELNGYAWLVNRADFDAGEVSFLVVDDETVTFDLPDGASLDDAEEIACGRYTVFDFAAPLPLGPQRS